MCRYFIYVSKYVLKINNSQSVAMPTIYMNKCVAQLENTNIYSKILFCLYKRVLNKFNNYFMTLNQPCVKKLATISVLEKLFKMAPLEVQRGDDWMLDFF